jgi:hypothetical protein
MIRLQISIVVKPDGERALGQESPVKAAFMRTAVLRISVFDFFWVSSDGVEVPTSTTGRDSPNQPLTTPSLSPFPNLGHPPRINPRVLDSTFVGDRERTLARLSNSYHYEKST